MLSNAVVAHGDRVREAAAWAGAAEVRDQWNAGEPGQPLDSLRQLRRRLRGP
jgi:hypothetical protein